MIINWYGEGCFKIQTGGITLLTDPFESSTGLTPARGKNEITLKTLTGWPLTEAKSEKGLPSRDLAKREKEENEEGQEIRGAGEYEIRQVSVSGFSLPSESSNTFFKTAYKATAEEITLGFLGHLSESIPPEALEKLKDVNILFIPAGGKPFINAEVAAKLIKQISPKIIVGSFFKTPGLKRSSSDWKAFADELGLKPEILEKLTVRKKDIAEQKGTKLIILKI